jgi:hypothetical protein
VKNTTKIAISAYVLMGIVTFGHCAAESNIRYAALKCGSYKVDESPNSCDGNPPFDGIVAAVTWPLYWSWEAFS